MQRKDIKTGELLAHREDERVPLKSALVLDISTLWKQTGGRGGCTWEPTEATRPGRRGGYAGHGATYWGWLAVVAESSYDRAERDRRAEALIQWLTMVNDPQGLTPESVAALAKSVPEDTRLRVIDGRHLRGKWLPTIRAQDRREDAAAAERDRENAERERLTAVYERTRIAWRERFGPESDFAFDPYTHSSFNARVPLERLAELLGERVTEQ